MKNFEEYKKDIERELMVKIIMGLRYGKISQQKAERLAQEYSEIMNAQNADELFAHLSKRLEQFGEILEIYLQNAADYFMQKTESLLQAGRYYMHQQQYEKAVAALKGQPTIKISASQGGIN